MAEESKANRALGSLGLVLYYNHKLGLTGKSREELEALQKAHNSSLYARMCRFLRLPYSQKYLAKSEAIQGGLEWHDIIAYRKQLFGRKNCLEIALSNEQLERMHGIKPELI